MNRQRWLILLSAAVLWATSLGDAAHAQQTFVDQTKVTTTNAAAPADAKADAKADTKAEAKPSAMFDDKLPGEDDERGFFEVHQWGVAGRSGARPDQRPRTVSHRHADGGGDDAAPADERREEKARLAAERGHVLSEAGRFDRHRPESEGGDVRGPLATAQVKSNRLHWPEYELAATAPADAAWLSVPPEHWFSTVRKTNALAGARAHLAERLLTYDFEAPFPLPLKLEGGPDTFNVRSTATYPVHDLVIVVPTESGRRIGWLDLLPAAPVRAAQAGPAQGRGQRNCRGGAG